MSHRSRRGSSGTCRKTQGKRPRKGGELAPAGGAGGLCVGDAGQEAGAEAPGFGSDGKPWTSPASSQEWAGRHWAVAEHPVSIFLAQEADVRPEAAGDRAEGCGRSRPEVWLPSPGTPVWPGTWSESLISHTGQGARLWPWPPGRRGAVGSAACCRAA